MARLQAAAAALLTLTLVGGCGTQPETAPTLFTRLPSDSTGITFANTLSDSPAFNIINYLYYYDGGGVAVGDVNGDDLVDLYFTANEGPNRLYLNRGDFRFKDVTDEAGVSGTGNWTTGTAMVDINGDRLLDIYVCVVGGAMDRDGRNQLFINNGDGTFTDRAAEYGLDFEGYGTHAVFFDYDIDGDVDVYLINHSVHAEGTYGEASMREEPHPQAGDRLFRNDGERFTDVTREAGIYSGVIGYGLSAVVSDVDLDGCPDLYVANDFHENDYLYRNNCDGTFTETIEQATGHVSLSSMGSDAADVNNDGLPDIVVVDMLPDREDIRKTSAGPEPVDIYNFKRSLGYHHQLARNTLQLNRGDGRFSEIGALAGIEATDWSWAPLVADFDLDGWKDLFVTNGIFRRPNDLDYSARVSSPAVQAKLDGQLTADDLSIVEEMPSVPIPNYYYRNNGDLTFTDFTAEAGVDEPGFSNGAAYADLDNDGDFDLVVNNVNAPAALYENRAAGRERHYLRVELEGDDANTAGIGAKVIAKTGRRTQLLEMGPARGYQSSVDPRLLFGLGEWQVVDSLIVVWPDARYQVLTDVAADQTVTLRQRDASGRYRFGSTPPEERLFVDRTEELGADIVHRENTFIDFSREPLMPHKLSTEGPALAVGDVNGDGLDDFFLGAAKRLPSHLYVQQSGGAFEASNDSVFREDSLYEDVDAVFFDADGDDDLDLFVVSGGNEYWGEAEALRSRLYKNDGAGRFKRAEDALPNIFMNGSCVATGDYDADGDEDLFLGARSVPRHYGSVPPSYLLENDGRGRFSDVTSDVAPGLSEAGMVTDAVWTDADGDGLLDLVVAGEWSPIRLFVQKRGRLRERADAFEGSNGWWNVIEAADLDDDGDEDLVAGNLGLNTLLEAAPTKPARLYLNDFDDNGSLDQVLTTYRHGKSYPIATVEMLQAQMPMLLQRFPRFADFGARTMEEIFSNDELQGVSAHEAYTFASAVAINESGEYTLHPLPTEAQLAPLQAFLTGDYDGDGRIDLLAAGNFFSTHPLLGRYDADMGLLLRGDGRGGFHPVPPTESGLFLHGDIRALRSLRGGNGSHVTVVARNDAGVLFLERRPAPPAEEVVLK